MAFVAIRRFESRGYVRIMDVLFGCRVWKKFAIIVGFASIAAIPAGTLACPLVAGQ